MVKLGDMDKKIKAIQEIFQKNPKTAAQLMRVKREVAKKHKIIISLNSDIIKELNKSEAKMNKNKFIELKKLLRKRAVRTLSGIAPVAVLTKPYPCPGKCAYCPTEKNVPQSYLSNEPAVMRAIRCNYNPHVQVQARLRALIDNGHNPEKIELIVIGGTWSVLPEKYKYFFIWQCFKAANEFNKIQKLKLLPAGGHGKIKNHNLKLKTEAIINNLLKEQKRNEKARYRIIGLTLETRPDYINEKELWQMRQLGCTRVELGVQAIDDEILKINKRGHEVKEIAVATKLLKDFGFKVTYHIMPGLPGSTPKKDLQMFKKLFTDEKFQPDQIKFYPTVVTKGSLLYKWWKTGKYKPYSNKQLQKLIIDCKKIIPPYVRIIRLIRDIPEQSIIAGNKITNLRQIMKDRGVECKCIRCREPKNSKIKNQKSKIKNINYAASEGEEYFIEFTSKDKKILYGFCRLRILPHNIKRITHNYHKKFPSFKVDKVKNQAHIRELHVYGELVPIGEKKKIQHSGLGKKLLKEAEKIAKQKNCDIIKIIAGVGVRNYYRKLEYKLNNSYMVKNIK